MRKEEIRKRGGDHIKQIVLISHGTMAEGMYKAAGMVFGNLPEVCCLCLSEDKDIRVFRRELGDILGRLNQEEPVAVLCDIGGGSPYNTALELLDEMGYMEKASVVSGMNLPLLIVLLMASDVGRDTVKSCVAEAGGSIRLFESWRNGNGADAGEGAEEEEEL